MVGQLPKMTGSCSFARTSVGCRRQSRDSAARSAEPTASVHTVVNKVSSVRSAPSLLQFRRDLKTALHVSVIVLFTIVFSCVTDCNCNL